MAENLAASYERCRILHRAHGRTYYLATQLLPAWKRKHVHALYGFARHTDEIVDRLDGTGPADRAVRLRRWADGFIAGLDGAPSADPVLPAVLDTVERFDLDRADFVAFLRSMEMDLTVTEYPTYDDLLDYMDGSAAAIGTMMLPILGARDLTGAREPARGRIYLPLKDLARFGGQPAWLPARRSAPRRQAVNTSPARAMSLRSIRPIA